MKPYPLSCWAQNVGVILDFSFSLVTNRQTISKPCQLYLQNISKMWPSLITFTTSTLDHFLFLETHWVDKGGKLNCSVCHLQSEDTPLYWNFYFLSSPLYGNAFIFLLFFLPEAFVPGVMKFYNDMYASGCGHFLFTVLNRKIYFSFTLEKFSLFLDNFLLTVLSPWSSY